MDTSSRLAVGIHAPTLLAAGPAESLTSEYIAGSANTHPVVIRRLRAGLRDAGLAGIYWALGGRLPFAPPRQEPNVQRAIGGRGKCAVEGVFDELEQAVQQRLARTTISDVLRRVRCERMSLTT